MLQVCSELHHQILSDGQDCLVLIHILLEHSLVEASCGTRSCMLEMSGFCVYTPPASHLDYHRIVHRNDNETVCLSPFVSWNKIGCVATMMYCGHCTVNVDIPSSFYDSYPGMGNTPCCVLRQRLPVKTIPNLQRQRGSFNFSCSNAHNSLSNRDLHH